MEYNAKSRQISCENGLAKGKDEKGNFVKAMGMIIWEVLEGKMETLTEITGKGVVLLHLKEGGGGEVETPPIPSLPQPSRML